MAAARPQDVDLTPAGAAFVVIAVAAAALVGAADAEPLPLLILLAGVALPIAAFAAVQAFRWNPKYVFGIGVLAIVLACATFRVREIEDKSIDAQILLRLASLAAFAALAATALMKERGPVLRGLPWVWFSFVLFNMATSLYSKEPALSLVETFSNLAVLAFVCAFRVRLGAQRLVQVLIVSCLVLCVLSIMAYVADPQLGRMSDWVNGAFVPTSRLSGIFGTANAAGAAAALGILFIILLSDLSPRRPLFYIVLVPMAFCLVASNNRMAVFALIVCLSYAWVARGEAVLKLALLLLAMGIGVLVLSLFGDTVLEFLSRSGSADEITSGTGRTRIWAVVIDLWSQQPIFGYGQGSAKFILPVHPLLFKAAAHAHNLYLNILFAGGVIGLGLFLAAVWTTFRTAVARRAHPAIAIMLFPLIYGLTEPAIGGLISFMPICFYGVVALISIRDPEPAATSGRLVRPAPAPSAVAKMAETRRVRG